MEAILMAYCPVGIRYWDYTDGIIYQCLGQFARWMNQLAKEFKLPPYPIELIKS